MIMEPTKVVDTTSVTEMAGSSPTKLDTTEKALTPADSTAAATEKESEDVSAVESSAVESKEQREDLDFVDPLQLARQVALEAKLEVDARAHSSSSSDQLPGGDVQRHSADPEAESGSVDDSSSAPDTSTDYSRPEEEEEADAEKVAAQEVEQSQLTEIPQADPEKGGFDLNKEADVPVSASAPALGSAVTSAFRPASPRRNTDAAVHSTGGSTSSRLLGIDLNAKVQSGMPSGESSVGGRLGFDLNLASEEAEEPAQVDWRAEAAAQLRRSGQSPSSSASSKRMIDLNSIHQAAPAAVDHRRPGGSFISIMGMKVEVPRSQYNPPPPPPLQFHGGVPHGAAYSPVPFHQPAGPMLQFSPAVYAPPGGGGAGYQYLVDSRGVPVVPQVMGSAPAHQPFFLAMPGGPSSNGSGPAIPQVMGSASGHHPFFLNMSGGLPSNGMGPAFPPVMGSTSAHQQYYLAMPGGQPSNGSGSAISHVMGPASGHHPFYLSIPGGPYTNGPGPGSVPSRNSFDLNNAGGNRNLAFVAPGLGGRSREEYVTSSQASTSSGAGGKRKEPEGGWEEPASNRQQPPRTWM